MGAPDGDFGASGVDALRSGATVWGLVESYLTTMIIVISRCVMQCLRIVVMMMMIIIIVRNRIILLLLYLSRCLMRTSPNRSMKLVKPCIAIKLGCSTG